MTNPADSGAAQVAQAANAEGMAAMRDGRFAEAAAAFRRAATADPGALPLWSNLAHACRMQRDGAGERAALNAALDIDRTHFPSQLRMAQLLQRLGEEQAAFQAWHGVQLLVAQMPPLSGQLAAEVADGAAWCAELQARLSGAAAGVVSAHTREASEMEARRIKAFVDVALGQRQVFHNECAGTYYPFLPADEYFDRGHFPWLDQLEAGHAAIRAELEGLIAGGQDLLRPYVRMEAGNPASKWDALDHSLDWSACFLYEYGRPNQPVLDRCPETARLLASLPLAQIPGRAPNAFFSLLAPHSHIPPHTGVTNTRAIIHLALIVPPGCGFRVGGETREWVEGKAFAFDDSIDHEAWNGSDQLRAVLIIDTWNPHLTERERAAIADYFAVADRTLAASPGG
ncbi:MAG: aspartyl/asparaginyl beta-hydroxylase domain-containing protein [Proteobacteria bacterium]|nr:aspartyl/asparaginyl beta-hydroxylase domain-containing protein [Pseudomonadota bacterium]